MLKKTTFSARAINLLGSSNFFWGVVLLLIVQAVWIALTGRYPMAFDESHHLGLIQLYAHHLSPFWSGQPANADIFGAVARDPAYLYHYVISFPYRLITVFTQDQTTQVLILRGLNIGLFASSLPLFRKCLAKTKAPPALVNTSLAAFVLLPISPLLAAQINYDNLMMPISALAILMAININQRLRDKRLIDVKILALLLVLCLLGSLVKYPFLPVFLAIFLYLLVRLKSTYKKWNHILKNLWKEMTALKTSTAWLLAVALIISGLLFVERYGVNIVRYHTPVPDCAKVLSIEKCSAYGPWIRDYDLSNKNDIYPSSKNPVIFADRWFSGMWLRTFFAVDGEHTNFQTNGPFIIPAISSIIFAVVGLISALFTYRRISQKYNKDVLGFLLAVSGLYIVVLWFDGYEAFIRTGLAVAINGRYLLPILPFMLIVVGLCLNYLLKKRPAAKVTVVIVVLACLSWGGGALTYILRSNDAWYWPNAAVKTANHSVKRVLGPVTPGYNNPQQFMSRN